MTTMVRVRIGDIDDLKFRGNFFQVEYSPINSIYGYEVYELGSRLTY